MQGENSAGQNSEGADRNWSDSWKPAVRGMAELLFYLPFLLLAVVWLLPQHDVYPWLLTLWLPYTAAALLIHKSETLKLWRRLLGAVLIGAVHIAVFAFLRGLTDYGVLWLLCIATSIWMADRGFAMRLQGWYDSFSFNSMAACILAYFILTGIIYWGPDRLAPYSAPAAFCGIAALILFLLTVNHRHLSREIIDRGKTSAVQSARRRNQWMMAILVGLTVFISVFRQLQQWVEQGLKGAFAALMELFRSEPSQPQPEEAIPESPDSMLPPVEPREPALWMKLLEQALWYIIYGLIIVAAIVLLFFAIRKLIGMSKSLWDKLFHTKTLDNGDDTAYKDEIESLVSLSKWKRNKSSKAKDTKRHASQAWSQLASNREKIRFLYVQMVKRGISEGYSYRKEQTPRETAEELAKQQEGRNGAAGFELDRFVDLYEQARYGGMEPDAREVELYRSRLNGEK
ncbi:DUF4129 domain-containing protein [Paenibacillus sp. CAU 1782]